MFPSRQTRNQYLSWCNNLWNNILSGLLFKYSFVRKDITCLIRENFLETSNEKIRKLWTNSDFQIACMHQHSPKQVWEHLLGVFDCIRFLIRRCPLYNYSKVLIQLDLYEYDIVVKKCILILFFRVLFLHIHSLVH